MKKQIGMVGVILAAVAVQAAPFVGKAVGTAVEKAVVREVVEKATEAGVKAVATRTMSSALAGLSAKTAIGSGALIKAFGFLRREVKMAFAPLSVAFPGPLQRPQESVQGLEGSVLQ